MTLLLLLNLGMTGGGGGGGPTFKPAWAVGANQVITPTSAPK